VLLEIMPWLEYTDEGGGRARRELGPAPLTIGRRSDSGLVFHDTFVSRRHATVEKRGEDYFVRDAGSTYGTFVNGEQVTKKILAHGDEITVGNTLLKFLESGGPVPSRKAKEAPQDSHTAVLSGLRESLTAIKSVMQQEETPEVLAVQMARVEAEMKRLEDRVREAEQAKKAAQTLYEVSKITSLVVDLRRLLPLIMDQTLSVMSAERGFLLMVNEKGEREIQAARNMGRSVRKGEAGPSETIANLALSERRGILTEDAQKDPRFAQEVSVLLFEIRSALAVPMLDKEMRPVGAIYVDRRVSKEPFLPWHLEFLQAFANQAALSIENARLYEKSLREERLRTNLQRYLSQPLVEKIVSGEGRIGLGGEERRVTVLFADIRSFTPMVEKMKPEEAVGMLNEYFTVMTEEVFREEGTVDKFIGDCLMAIFGAPIAHPDDPLRAVRTALGMRRALLTLKKHWLAGGGRFGKPLSLAAFEIGIGINTGPAIAGNIGSEKRMDYTVISDAVNLASRLEGVAKAGEVLISEETYREVRDKVRVIPKPPVRVQGKSEPIQSYSVQGLL